MAASWIDDIGIIVTGETAKENCWVLQTIHTRAELWARQHASVFAPAKYELIHFTNRPEKHSTSAELVLDNPHSAGISDLQGPRSDPELTPGMGGSPPAYSGSDDHEFRGAGSHSRLHLGLWP